MIEVHREQRGRAPATVTARRDADAARAARKIVKQALEAELEEASVGLAAWRTWPWGRLARIAAIAAATVAVGLGTAKVFFPAGDLATFSREELLRISPMLASGGRNRQGSGPAFVGTLEERWAELAADEKNEAASSLVERLHAQGVSQVMVYDETRQLRIQALGAERVKVLPAKSQAAQTPDPS
jgi:hypothetical protein